MADTISDGGSNGGGEAETRSASYQQVLRSRIPHPSRENLARYPKPTVFGLMIDSNGDELLYSFLTHEAPCEWSSGEDVAHLVATFVRDSNTDVFMLGQVLSFAITGSTYHPKLYPYLCALGKNKCVQRIWECLSACDVL